MVGLEIPDQKATLKSRNNKKSRQTKGVSFEKQKRYMSIGGASGEMYLLTISAHLCTLREEGGSPDEWKKRHIGIVPLHKLALHSTLHSTLHNTLHT